MYLLYDEVRSDEIKEGQRERERERGREREREGEREDGEEGT